MIDFTTRFGFSLTFYRKFDKIIKELELFQQPKSSSTNYLKAVIQLGWFLFIDSKGKLFNYDSDVIQITCLLASIINYLCSHSIDNIRSRRIIEAIKDQKNHKEYKDACTFFVQDLFKIRDSFVF